MRYLPRLLSVIAAISTFLVAGSFEGIHAQAIPICPNPRVITDPDPLFDNTPSAKFTVNVGNNKEPGVNSWKMQFRCGARPLMIDKADLEGDEKSISTRLENQDNLPGIGRCEFDSRNPFLDIYVYAVKNDGESPFCRATYQIRDSAKECKLEINPTEGITVSTALTVKGTNLKPGGRYVLFFDDDGLGIEKVARDPGFDISYAGNVETPTFTKTIPSEKMTLGPHTVSLRQRNGNFNLQSLLLGQEKDYFGPALCSAAFLVGTSKEPGKVLETGSVPIALQPAKAGGESCGTAEHPAIQTAIGCIHTNPVGFVKDLMRFIVSISGGIAFLLMILGVFRMLTSAGNPQSLKEGQDILTSAVIGLLLVIFATLLLKIIGVDILNIPGFT